MFLLPRPAAPVLIQHLLYSIEEVLRYNGLWDALVELSRPKKFPLYTGLVRILWMLLFGTFPCPGPKSLVMRSFRDVSK
jgi:hypothetical protein